MHKFLFFLFIIFPVISYGQLSTDPFAGDSDDLNIGGDIFSDFNEDLEATQVMEDERFFRYGRFFTVQLSIGITSFDGNRGTAYENDPPSFGLGVNYFTDFQSSFGMGFEFSKHHFFIDQPVNDFNPDPPGLIDVSMLRIYFSYRYYIDTANLGTAITYANPYFVGRLEYWYTTNKFRDQEELANDSGGGLGFGLGFGGEFPIKIKESYLGVEFLYHSVDYHDKFTQSYRPIDGSTFGFEDLTGNAYSTMVSYVINW